MSGVVPRNDRSGSDLMFRTRNNGTVSDLSAVRPVYPLFSPSPDRSGVKGA